MKQETMNCKDFRGAIELGNDPTEVGSDLGLHAENCRECQKFLKDRTSLSSLLKELTPVSAPNDFEWRLRARLRGVDSRNSGFASGFERTAARFGRIPVAASAIALLVITVVGGGYLMQQRGLVLTPKLRQAMGYRGDYQSPMLSFVQVWSNEQTPAPLDNEGPKGYPPTSRHGFEGHDRAVNVPRPPGNFASGVSRGVRSTEKALSRPDVYEKQVGTTGWNEFTVSGVGVEMAGHELKVILPGEKGKVQTVALRSVTFGAQQILDRPNSRRSDYSKAQGIW